MHQKNRSFSVKGLNLKDVWKQFWITYYLYIYMYLWCVIFPLFSGHLGHLGILADSRLFFGRSWPTFWHRRRRATSAQSVGAWGIHKDSRLESPLEIPTFDVSTKNITDLLFFVHVCVFFPKWWQRKVEDFNLLWRKRIGIPWTVSRIFDESFNKNSPACQRVNHCLSKVHVMAELTYEAHGSPPNIGGSTLLTRDCGGIANGLMKLMVIDRWIVGTW